MSNYTAIDPSSGEYLVRSPRSTLYSPLWHRITFVSLLAIALYAAIIYDQDPFPKLDELDRALPMIVVGSIPIVAYFWIWVCQPRVNLFCPPYRITKTFHEAEIVNVIDMNPTPLPKESFRDDIQFLRHLLLKTRARDFQDKPVIGNVGLPVSLKTLDDAIVYYYQDLSKQEFMSKPGELQILEADDKKVKEKKNQVLYLIHFSQHLQRKFNITLNQLQWIDEDAFERHFCNIDCDASPEKLPNPNGDYTYLLPPLFFEKETLLGSVNAVNIIVEIGLSVLYCHTAKASGFSDLYAKIMPQQNGVSKGNLTPGQIFQNALLPHIKQAKSTLFETSVQAAVAPEIDPQPTHTNNHYYPLMQKELGLVIKPEVDTDKDLNVYRRKGFETDLKIEFYRHYNAMYLIELCKELVSSDKAVEEAFLKYLEKCLENDPREGDYFIANEDFTSRTLNPEFVVVALEIAGIIQKN